MGLKFREDEFLRVAAVVARLNPAFAGQTPDSVSAHMRNTALSVPDRRGYVRIGGYVLTFYNDPSGEIGVLPSIDSILFGDET